ncbi:hypothetical protein DPEC_G00309920 [Dallia pectoralis]|uniref:Uncharacterized protein n=1 Tax=Dallia pectoralis TaxID=75939 RepID=A0ACC2FEW1_DALPE|nr:hypothetical protein DPEC_G00309920 [Dallia pectoralis]
MGCSLGGVPIWERTVQPLCSDWEFEKMIILSITPSVFRTKAGHFIYTGVRQQAAAPTYSLGVSCIFHISHFRVRSPSITFVATCYRQDTEMAGKRAAVKAIDWLAFAERVPPNQRAMFNSLKTRSDAIGAKLASLPVKPVTIDWSFYKTNVALPGMVAEFESKFTALTIPEPKDTATAEINAQEAESNKSATTYIQASRARIAAYEKELEKLRNMVPFDQMTVDDLNDVFPETKLDKQKYPYWPNKPIADL